ASVFMPAARTGDPSESKAAYQDLLERLRALPGVESASLVQYVPLSGMIPTTEVQFPQQNGRQSTSVNVIAPSYVETMKISILNGRSFDERDHAESPTVVMVNQAAARKFWPDQNPIGQRVNLQTDEGGMETCEVIGVVADSRYGHIVDP